MTNVYLVFDGIECENARPSKLVQYLEARSSCCVPLSKTHRYSVICDARDGSIHYATTVTEEKDGGPSYEDARKKGTAIVEGPMPSEKLVFLETIGVGLLRLKALEEIFASGALSPEEIQNVKEAIAKRRNPEERVVRDDKMTARLFRGAKAAAENVPKIP